MSEIHIGLASRAVRQPGAPLHRAHERRCDSAEHRLDNKLSLLPRRAVAVEMCCSLLAAQKPSGTLRQGPCRLAELLCRSVACSQCAEWLSVAHKWAGWGGIRHVRLFQHCSAGARSCRVSHICRSGAYPLAQNRALRAMRCMRTAPDVIACLAMRERAGGALNGLPAPMLCRWPLSGRRR